MFINVKRKIGEEFEDMKIEVNDLEKMEVNKEGELVVTFYDGSGELSYFESAEITISED
jgi:hypothetical protein